MERILCQPVPRKVSVEVSVRVVMQDSQGSLQIIAPYKFGWCLLCLGGKTIFRKQHYHQIATRRGWLRLERVYQAADCLGPGSRLPGSLFSQLLKAERMSGRVNIGRMCYEGERRMI
jgi:hypothetical protein